MTETASAYAPDVPCESTTVCPFCGSLNVAFWQTKSANSSDWQIWKCKSCRSAFVWPRPTDIQLQHHYASGNYGSATLDEADLIDSAYYPRSWDDAEVMIGRCSALTRGRSLLDIGAGIGAFSHVAMKHGFRVDAIEPNHNSCAIFHRVNGFRPRQEFFDLASSTRFECSYDVAILSQVLEHLPDPVHIVNALRVVLRRGGIAAIAVPHFHSLLSLLQGRGDMFISPPEHLNFFSRRGLTQLFVKRGFRLRLIETVSKVPRRKIERLLHLRTLGALGWRAVFGGMLLSNWCGAGMFLNAYFERTEAHGLTRVVL